MSLFDGMTLKQPQKEKEKIIEVGDFGYQTKKELEPHSEVKAESAFSFLLEGQDLTSKEAHSTSSSSLADLSGIDFSTMGQNPSSSGPELGKVATEDMKMSEDTTSDTSSSLLSQGNAIVDRIREKLWISSDNHDPYSIMKYSEDETIDPSSTDNVKFVETDEAKRISSLYPDEENLFMPSFAEGNKYRIPSVKCPNSSTDEEERQESGELDGGPGTNEDGQLHYNLDYSSDEKFQLLLQIHSSKMTSLNERQKLLETEVKKITSGRIQSIISLTEKHHLLHELQEKQSRAVMDEDYEKAEIFSKECAELEAEMNILPELSLNTHFIMSELLKSAIDLHSKHRSGRQRILAEMSKMKNVEEKILENVLHKIEEVESKSVREIGHMKTELDQTRSVYEVLQKKYEEKETVLQTKIGAKTQEFEEKKEEIIKEKSAVEDEIKALEEKLRELKQKETELAEAIDEQDKLIAMATVEFNSEVEDLEQTNRSLQTSDGEVKEKMQALEKLQEQYDEELRKSQESKARHEQLITEVSKVSDTEEHLLQNLPSDISWSVGSPPSFTLSESYLSLQDNCKEKEDQMRRLSGDLLQGQKKVVSLKQKVTDLEGHIANLQQTKQLAVDGKEFSEAKKLSEEIKNVTDEGKKYQTEMEDQSQKNEELHQAIQELQENCKELRKNADEERTTWEIELKDKMIGHFQKLFDDQEQPIVKTNPAVEAILMSELQTSCLLLNHLCEKLQFSLPEDVNDQVQNVLDGIERLEVQASFVENENSTEEFSDELSNLDTALQSAVQTEDYQSANIQKKITNLKNASLET